MPTADTTTVGHSDVRLSHVGGVSCCAGAAQRVLVAASFLLFFFFFNDTAPTEISPLPLHDALPICWPVAVTLPPVCPAPVPEASSVPDRKSTRLNSSHANISYAVFCLKKQKTK